MNPYPRTWAEVDLAALRDNLEKVRAMSDPAQVCLVAKADGYGHGLVPIGRAAARAGLSWLAVATVSEAVALRDAGIEGRIMILSPVLPIELDQAVFYDLEITLESPDPALALSRAAQKQGKTARFHLKVDTGLSRFGCSSDQVVETAQACLLPGLRLAGVTTHLVDSRSNPEKTARQLEEFDVSRKALTTSGIQPEVWHCANSFGAEQHPSSRHDLVRVGMHAYGIDGRPDSPFRPVMALKSRIVADRVVPQGATVGYNATWEAPRPTRILTIGAGYGDGYPRHLSGKASVLIQGVPCPVRGIICMDLFMVEGDDVPDAQVGDEVVLLGPGASASQLASWAGTNAHEIVTRIAPRVPRRYLNL